MHRYQKEYSRSVLGRMVAAAGLLLGGALGAASPGTRPMVVLETRYQVRVGEATAIPAAADTLDFMLHAKTRRVTAGGQDLPGVVVAPNEAQDQILLAASSKAAPGEYAATLSATSAAGEEMHSQVEVVVEHAVTVPKSSTRPPVVLLNGWEVGFSNTCPVATSPVSTFGNLATYLVSDGVPVVYLFDNCAEDPGQTIETLGNDLATFLNNIKYDDGTQVPQIDLVAHSMGGLIARAYLAGLQPNGTYQPPAPTLVRKLVLIATPNFGSFVAGNYGAGFAVGSQSAELVPGSAFLWNLATWNQRGDDLAGVDAIAIVGNAGAYATLASVSSLLNASDGLVSTTSASMSFVSQKPALTRIVPYCHIDPGAFTNTALGTFNCSQPGIAYIRSAAHPTSVIVRSFLAGTTDWQSVGTAPTADTYLATNGGTFFAVQNSTARYYQDLTSVIWGNVALTDGGDIETIYYTDFVTGTGAYTATSSSAGNINCGTLAVAAGYFAATRCKFGAAIVSITPLATTVTGEAVTAGTAITLNGENFGAQCGNCTVSATPAGSTTPATLTVTSWSNTAIVAQLPASFTGYLTISVSAVAGVDAMGVRAVAQSSVPALAVTPVTLQYAYSVGGTVPAAQSLAISNGGTGTLDWTATASDSWISLSAASGTAPSTVAVSVVPAGLAAGTYNGTVQITSAGATNSPLTVAVSLVVSGAPPVLTVSPQTLTFQYTAGGTVPAAQSLAISNGGGGSLSWVAASGAYWAVISPAAGTAPGTVAVSVIPGNLAAGTYTTNVTIAAADGSLTPVPVVVTLNVEGTPPVPAITAAANAASYQTTFASATWVAIFGTNLSQITYSWQAGDFVNGALPASLQGVSVTINGVPAYISFISPTQINVLAPDDAMLGQVTVQVTTAKQASNAFKAQKAQFAPAFLTFDGTYVAATHLNYSLVGKPGLLAGATTTPAKPGETIVLYGVGFGPSNPPLPTGQIVGTAEPLANTVKVSIGGVDAQVAFAGLSGPGLYQFNVTVPAGLAAGDAAVSATIGGINTQTGVAVSVQP
jgi:uncharacterized protein (TIGR03437 family)